MLQKIRERIKKYNAVWWVTEIISILLFAFMITAHGIDVYRLATKTPFPGLRTIIVYTVGGIVLVIIVQLFIIDTLKQSIRSSFRKRIKINYKKPYSEEQIKEFRNQLAEAKIRSWKTALQCEMDCLAYTEPRIQRIIVTGSPDDPFDIKISVKMRGYHFTNEIKDKVLESCKRQNNLCRYTIEEVYRINLPDEEE